MENGFFAHGFYLLITSLLGGIVALVVYIWNVSSRDIFRQMRKMEKCVESHNDRLLVLETQHANNHWKKSNTERRTNKNGM
jgi:hypothetical protein